jgi:hypothetical protein
LALRYKLGVDILVGNLVWIQGPYPAGKYNDIKIFNSVLHHYLEPGERMEVDNGYVGHADKIKCPDNTCNPEENLAMQACVRSWHETLNGQLKIGVSLHRYTAKISLPMAWYSMHAR